jgi:hypothetical protein
MADRTPRLGDEVDDYCPRCRLLLNHDVASLLNAEVVKVTCRTCYNTHDYRHAQAPARRKKPADNKQQLMEQVLAGLGRTQTLPAAPKPDAPTPEPPSSAPAPDDPGQSASAPPPGAPPSPKKRDLWAEYERIQQQRRK